MICLTASSRVAPPPVRPLPPAGSRPGVLDFVSTLRVSEVLPVSPLTPFYEKVQAHYDLSDDFFSLFLDPTRTTAARTSNATT